MPKALFAWLALAAAAFAAPVSAAPQSPTAAADQRFQAFGAWSQRVTTAMTPMNEAAARFAAKVQQLPPPDRDPAVRAQQVAAFRALIAEVRRAVQESRSQLALIPRFEGRMPGMEHMDVNRLLAEVKGQTDRMLAYMDDAEAFADALVKGDPAATQAAARKLIRGGFLLMDSQVILYRGRQALFPPDRSGHQLVGVTLQLYRTMSVAAEAWFKASVEGDPKAAAQMQRTRFLELAAELETVLRQGRANLAAELALFKSEKKRAARDPAMLRILARAEEMSQTYVTIFALGDDLAAWLRAKAETPGAALAAQTQPELILELAAMEQRLLASGADAAATLAKD